MFRTIKKNQHDDVKLNFEINKHLLSRLRRSHFSITYLISILKNKHNLEELDALNVDENKNSPLINILYKKTVFHEYFFKTYPSNRAWAFIVGDFVTHFPFNKANLDKKRPTAVFPESVNDMSIKEKLVSMRKTYRSLRPKGANKSYLQRLYIWMPSRKGYNRTKNYPLISKYRRLRRPQKFVRRPKLVFYIPKKKIKRKKKNLDLWSHNTILYNIKAKKHFITELMWNFKNKILLQNKVSKLSSTQKLVISFKKKEKYKSCSVSPAFTLLNHTIVGKYKKHAYYPIVARKFAWFISRHVSPCIFQKISKFGQRKKKAVTRKKKNIFLLLKRSQLRIKASYALSKSSFKLLLCKILTRLAKKIYQKSFLKSKTKKPLRKFQKKRPRLNLISKQTLLKKLNRKYSFPLLFSDINSPFIGSSWAFIKIVNNFFDYRRDSVSTASFMSQTNILLTRRNDPFQYILRRYARFENDTVEPINRKKLEKSWQSKNNTKNIAPQEKYGARRLSSQPTQIDLHSNMYQWFNNNDSLKNWHSINFNKQKSRRISITRIKFRPGYQVLWRRVRANLKHVLNLKYRYQKPLTRFISRFSKVRGVPLLKKFEMSLTAILLSSRFVLTKNAAFKMISARWIYINGISCVDSNRVLVPGDVIQIPVSNAYYVAYRWMLSENFKLHTRLYPQLASMNATRKQSKPKTPKAHYPQWILNARMLTEDIPSFLEVDFLSLSIVVLFEPSTVFDFEKFKFKYLELFSPKLYNWKYIT